jgi:hypothetical protein
MKERVMSTEPIKHMPCNEQLKLGTTDPKPNDMVTCPKCLGTWPYEVVKRELGEYVADETAKRLSKSFRDSARGIKGMTFKENVRPKKVRRFVVDLKL